MEPGENPLVVTVKTLNDALIKLRDYEVETTSKFVVADSCSVFSSEKVELTDKLRLHWDDDQTPYFHFGSRKYLCHQGKDINVYQKKKYAQLRDKKAQVDHLYTKRYMKAQLTKKLDCPAKIQMTRIVKIFEHKVTGSFLKYVKDQISCLIKQKIAKNIPVGEELYVIKFPNQEEHKYHLQGANAAIMEPVDVRVKEYIAELVRGGEKNPVVVSKLLEIFVKNELQENNKKRRRFYPNLKTIRQIVSSAKGKLKNSPIDQENTEHIDQENTEDIDQENIEDIDQENIEYMLEDGNVPLRGSRIEHLINDCNATMSLIQSALWNVEEDKLEALSISLKEIYHKISSDITTEIADVDFQSSQSPL